MKILDRYIFFKFLKTYLFSVFIIVLIIMVIDFVEKNDNFIQKNVPSRAIFFDYYLNLAPHWANYISPLMVFISTVFFTATLAARTEIVAYLSSGASFLRLMIPYFMASTVVAVISFAMVGWIIPKANQTRIGFENQYLQDKFYFSDRNFHMAVAPNVYAYLSSYNNDSKTAFEFSLEKIEDNKLVEKLMAKRILYIDSLDKWRIYDYQVRHLGTKKDDITYNRNYIDSTINMTPKDFENNLNRELTMNNFQLNDHIDLLANRGSEGKEVYQIEFYQRFATPFAIIILSMMGLIVSARKTRGGVGLQIAIGFVLAFTYILFYIMSKGMAQAGNMPPLLAVWLPNIVFSIVALIMYYTVPR